MHPRLATSFKWAAIFLVAILILSVASPAAAHAAVTHAAHLPSFLSGAGLLAAGVLAPQVDSLDAIPENARAAYVEKDGKFILDVDESAFTSGLKNKNSELLTKLTAAQKRAALFGDRSDDDIKADLELAQQAREKKAKAEGDFESLKGQLVQENAKALEKANGRTTKFEKKLYDVMARRELETAIVAAGGNPKVLLPHMLPFVKVNESDDDFVAQVVDDKGKVRIADGNGTEMSIAQLVDQFKADETFGIAFAPSGASGGGARNGGGAGGKGGGQVVIIPRDADPQTYRRMKEDAEKRGVLYKVAD